MMRCVHPVLSPVINAKLAMYFDELCEEHLVQPTFVTEYGPLIYKYLHT